MNEALSKGLTKQEAQRAYDLTNLLMTFDGQGFVGKTTYNRDFNVHWTELITFSVEKWDELIKGLRKVLNERLPDRPSIQHGFITQKWVVDEDAFSIYDALSTDTICQFFDDECDGDATFFKNRHEIAKAIAVVPQLVQLAEMYFDTLKSKGAYDSVPFNLALETLKSLE